MDGRIGRAITYFTQTIAVLPDAGTKETLNALLTIITARLLFVLATLTDENPYHIYKSLNSTGVPLGPVDLDFARSKEGVLNAEGLKLKRECLHTRRTARPNLQICDVGRAVLESHLVVDSGRSSSY